MTPFEYVTVLISIILGMGITQIITGVADLVNHWNRVRIYWPHLLLIVLVFFLQIQEWWDTYELRKFESLRLPTFLFVLFYPINLFILARILFPLVQPEGDIDLSAFYRSNYRKFFWWASVLPVLSMLNNSGFPRDAHQGARMGPQDLCHRGRGDHDDLAGDHVERVLYQLTPEWPTPQAR
jgi:hypothetical protein